MNVSVPLVDCVLLGQRLETESQFEKNNNERLKFAIVDSYEYDINGNGINEKIILEKLQISWNEPGDFHRIRIEYNDTCYTFFNSSGWIKTSPFIFEYLPNFTTYNKVRPDYTSRGMILCIEHIWQRHCITRDLILISI